MSTAVFGQGLLGSVQLLFQQLEAQPGFFRVWPVVVVVFAGAVVIVVIAAGIAVVSRGVFGAGVFTHERLGVIRVEEAGHDVADATFILDDAVVGLNHGAGSAREMCYSGHDVADAFLDALGDDDLAFAGQQLNSAHLAHVHAHRICGAASVGLNGGKSSSGFGGSSFVGSGVTFGHQQGIRVWCLFAHLDTHVVDHPDNVFNLIRICDIFREVIVYLGVSQVTLFLASCDEVFQT